MKSPHHHGSRAGLRTNIDDLLLWQWRIDLLLMSWSIDLLLRSRSIDLLRGDRRGTGTNIDHLLASYWIGRIVDLLSRHRGIIVGWWWLLLRSWSIGLLLGNRRRKGTESDDLLLLRIIVGWWWLLFHDVDLLLEIKLISYA